MTPPVFHAGDTRRSQPQEFIAVAGCKSVCPPPTEIRVLNFAITSSGMYPRCGASAPSRYQMIPAASVYSSPTKGTPSPELISAPDNRAALVMFISEQG